MPARCRLPLPLPRPRTIRCSDPLQKEAGRLLVHWVLLRDVHKQQRLFIVRHRVRQADLAWHTFLDLPWDN